LVGNNNSFVMSPTEYKRNKLRTAWNIVRRIKNWPTAFALRLRQQQPALRMLSFRDGLNVVCRSRTRDWDVVYEVLFAGGYGRAMNYLKGLPGTPVVLDLGGNIGMFSLLAASAHPAAEIYAFEPGPPNYRLFEMNRLANPAFSDRIHLRKEAVAGKSGTVEWFFDETNPGGSGMFATNGTKFSVQIRAFAEVLSLVAQPISLAKIDIEGSEFELLKATPPEAWKRINAVSLELHNDPERQMTQDEFLKRMVSYGFKIEDEGACALFLRR
jgi:FkbM family methyltransferase